MGAKLKRNYTTSNDLTRRKQKDKAITGLVYEKRHTGDMFDVYYHAMEADLEYRKALCDQFGEYNYAIGAYAKKNFNEKTCAAYNTKIMAERALIDSIKMSRPTK